MFQPITTSIEHNDGGANCFISNNINHFTNFIAKPILVKQLNGSTVKAIGYGLKLLQCPATKTIIPLWPTYYMPTNPQNTFSPTALQHYLHYKIVTIHLDSLSITTSNGTKLIFPSVKTHSLNQLLDYHQFTIVKTIHPRGLAFINPLPIVLQVNHRYLVCSFINDWVTTVTKFLTLCVTSNPC